MIQKLQRGNKLNLQYLGLVRPVVPGMTPNTSSTITYNPQEEQNKKKAAEEARRRRKYQQNKQIISATPPRDESLFGIWRRQQDAQAYEQNRQEDAFKSGAAQVLPYFVPGIGQYLMVKDFSDALYEGRNGEAALMLGLTAAPFAFKGVRKLFNKPIIATESAAVPSSTSGIHGSYDGVWFDESIGRNVYSKPSSEVLYFGRTKSPIRFSETPPEEKIIPNENNLELNRFREEAKEVAQSKRAGYFTPYSKQIDDIKEGLQFASNYFQSDGFLKRTADMGAKYNGFGTKHIAPRSNQVTYSPGWDNADANLRFGLKTGWYNNNLSESAAHEAFHWNPLYNNLKGYSKKLFFESPYYGQNYSMVPREIKEILTPERIKLEQRNKRGLGDLKHDFEINESYSDLGALRQQLQKSGVFDSFENNNTFNQKMLDEFRKLYRKEGTPTERFLNLHTDDQIIKAINEIAENNNSNLNNYV